MLLFEEGEAGVDDCFESIDSANKIAIIIFIERQRKLGLGKG